MKIEIPSWKSFMYVRVWEITKMKDGAIMSTKDTKKCIHSDYEYRINRDKYTTSPVTPTLKHTTLELNAVSPEEFQ